MKRVKTVYDHIRSNNIKTAVLVALFPLLFIALIFLFVWFVAPIETAIQTAVMVAIPTFIACMIWMVVSWAFGDSMMLNSAHAHEIFDNMPEYKQVFRSVENVAIAAGLPTPRVYVIDDSSLNAFATGRGPRDASVALTQGIIQKLDKFELEGVIAHEMAHIGNRDIRLDMLLVTGIGVTVYTGDILEHAVIYGDVGRDENDKNNIVLIMVWLAFSVFNLFITPILRMAISRKREFAADATGAQITRNPRALASALEKIVKNPRVKSLDGNKSMASVCIAYPGTRKFLGNLFATHPDAEERIKRLKSMA